MATFSDKLALIVTANSTQAVSELKKLGGAAENATADMKKIGGSGISGAQALAGFGAAAAITVGAFKSLVSAGREAAETDRITEAVLISTGGAAHVTAEQVHNLAEALSAKTGIDNTAIQSTENLLLTFRNVRNEAGKGNDIFNQATASILDMSVAMHEDAQTATIQLGKALQDPIAGLGKLSKIGVTFTEQQKEQIKVLVKSGQTLQAQKIILGEISAEFGGAAAAAADPMQKLDAQVKQLEEDLGQQLLPTVNRYVSGLQGLVTASTFAEHQTNKVGLNFGLVIGSIVKAIPGVGLLASSLDTFGAKQNNTTEGSKRAAAAYTAVQEATKQYAADVAQFGSGSLAAAHSHDVLTAAQGRLSVIQNAVTGAIQEGTVATEKATTADAVLSAAKKKLNEDLFANNTGALAADYKTLTNATLDAAVASQQVAAAERVAQAAADITTGSVLTLADAYQILGQSAAQDAVSSLGNLTKAATSQFDASQAQSSSYEQLGQSLSDLTAKQTSGGGSTRNLTAEYYDHLQKLQSVRDATQALGDTQVALQRAEYDQKTALLDAASAATAYQEALHGVAATSAKALGAKSNVAEAKDNRASANLDVRVAIVALTEAQKKYGKNSEEAQRAGIALREAHRRLYAATEDLTAAQGTLTGTLKGFAANSPQVVLAANNLRDAQNKVADATTNVREATDGVHDAQTAAARSTADLQGALNKVSTGGATKQLESFATKLDAVKTNAIKFAQDVGANVALATGSVAGGITAEIDTLATIINQNPLLKGAFDTVLQNLRAELARFNASSAAGAVHFQTAGPAPGRVQRFAEGGFVQGPKGAAVPIIAHAGEFVMSSAMLRANAPIPLGKHAASAPVYVQVIVDPVTGEQTVRQLQAHQRRNGPLPIKVAG